MLNKGNFIYSVSEKRHKLSRRDKIEKVGSTNDLAGRLYEHNRSSGVYIPYEYNYCFKIIDLCERTLKELEENEIHLVLGRRKTDAGAGKEFFFIKKFKPSYQLIRDYLDCKNIPYKFYHRPDIKPKARKPSPLAPQDKVKSITLRDHQLEAHSLMDDNVRYTFIFPAGTGKGFTFESYIQKNPGKYLILVPNRILVKQTCKRLAENGVRVFSYRNDIPAEDELVIVSTYHSSTKFKDIDFDTIHYDEAHRTVISTKNELSAFQCMIKCCKAKKQFFWTATPKFLTATEEIISMDNKGYFGDKYELALDEAIEKEYICDYIVRINSKENIEKKLINIFTDRLTRPWKAIIFFNTMDEADQVRDLLEKKLTKYKVFSYHSNSKNHKTLEIFKEKRRCVLCVCGMMSLGYDQPDVDTIIHYSTTTSPILHTQRNGRGQRISQSKQCNSIYYFVRKSEEISTIISQLSEQDKRFKYSIRIVEAGDKRGVSHSGGKIVCTIDLGEPIELTREMLKGLSNDPKLLLRRLLRYKNRYRITCIDKKQAIDEYSAWFPDITKICQSIKNFPEFCLDRKRYLEYTSRFIVNIDEIWRICEKEKIYNTQEYKRRAFNLKLPSYEFIVNGGVDIKNLNQFLPKGKYSEEY